MTGVVSGGPTGSTAGAMGGGSRSSVSLASVSVGSHSLESSSCGCLDECIEVTVSGSFDVSDSTNSLALVGSGA